MGPVSRFVLCSCVLPFPSSVFAEGMSDYITELTVRLDCRLCGQLEEEKGSAVQTAQHLPSRMLFIRSYLKALWKDQGRHVTYEADEELALLYEVQAYTLASHFFWALWSTVNARISSISFGYWEYAVERFESYFYWKNNLTLNNPGIDLPVKRKLDDVEG